MAQRRARRGTGTVYEKEGGWVARFPVGKRDGRRVYKWVRTRTEDEARDELDRLRRAYGAGLDPATQPLDDYLADWLRDHGRSVRPSTARSYAEHVRLHIGPVLGGIVVGRLRPADVRRLVDDLERKGKSPATIHRVVTTLSIALNAAVAEHVLPDNAAAGIRLPRVPRAPVEPLTHADADRIREVLAEHWLGPLVRLLLGSGLRLGEALGLDQRDVVWDAGFVRLRTSKTEVRAVPVSRDALDALRDAVDAAPRRGPGEPVFWSPRARRGARGRGRLSGWTVSHALPRVMEDAGLGHLHPHLLRHGVATLLVADGVHMRVVAAQLGHRNPALTARVYAHVVPDLQRTAIEVLDRPSGGSPER